MCLRTLIFGGSFNPPHLGHIALAKAAMDEFGYERVLLVPAWKPPHKDLSGDPGPADRLAMLEAACTGSPGLEVEDCELRRKGTSFSIDTVRELVGSGRIAPHPGFLLGEDLASGFGGWKEPGALASETDLILMRRPGTNSTEFPWPHLEFDNPGFDISSSMIRRLIGEGGNWKDLVPPGVRSIIEAEGHYGYR